MDAWHILSAGCLCALGVLTFLRVVADELGGVASELDAFRRREQARGTSAAIEAVPQTAVVESTLEKSA